MAARLRTTTRPCVFPSALIGSLSGLGNVHPPPSPPIAALTSSSASAAPENINEASRSVMVFVFVSTAPVRTSFTVTAISPLGTSCASTLLR